MTSRDGSNRNDRSGSSPQQRGQSQQRQGGNWELDADELDRYMSGQPAKQPRFDPYGRSQSTGRIERAPVRRQQPAQPQYQDYPEDDVSAQQYDDDAGYADDAYGYDEYEDPTPAPARTRSRQQQRQTARQRSVEPEYDDDLYDDPYVLDDEEDDTPRRPARRSAAGKARAGASVSVPSVSVPSFIADAPLVKDRTALIMLGTALLSALVLIIVVATQRSGLAASIFTHVNANGDAATIEDSSAIWRLPLIAGMVTLMNASLAWFLARWGSFLPRFLIGGAIGVQFFVWVATISYFK